MEKKLKSNIGRFIIMILVLATAISSFLVLFIVGRGGAISQEGIREGMAFILKFYMPFFVIMTAFYFAEHKTESKDKSTSWETFIFSIIVIMIWICCPPIFFYFSSTYESAIRNMNTIEIYGTNVASGAMVYYFSKSS